MESCVLYCADKVVPVEGDKGAAGVAIETTVANCSRPSEPSTAVSCAVGAETARVGVDEVAELRRKLRRLSRRVAALERTQCGGEGPGA